MRRIGSGLTAICLVVGVPATSAAATEVDADERQLLDLLNGARAAHGLPPLRVEATLDAGAADHAASMAGAGRLFHTSMTGSAPAGWLRLGENVVVADGAPAAHLLLMASPTHRAAMLDGGFDGVGIGVTHGAGDSHWVSMKLADGPGGAPAGGPGRWASPEGRVTTVGLSFHGDLAGSPPAAPIVGLVPTPSGAGYWLVGRDGGVFTFGDARYFGSTGGLRLAAPIVGMTAMPDGSGYWLAGADGGVFAFGGAPFLGSMAGQRLSAPIARINGRSTGRGYALYGSDGARHAFGDAR